MRRQASGLSPQSPSPLVDRPAGPAAPVAVRLDVGVGLVEKMTLAAVGLVKRASALVLSTGDRLKVAGVAARRVAAQVVDLEAVGDGAEVEPVHQPVSGVVLPAPAGFAVPTTIDPALPDPTATRPGGHVDSFQQSLQDGVAAFDASTIGHIGTSSGSGHGRGCSNSARPFCVNHVNRRCQLYGGRA